MINVFNSLSLEDILKIVKLQLDKLRIRLQEQKMDIKVSDDAVKALSFHGYDPVYGARPLKRVIQTEIQNQLASLYLEGKVEDGDTVKISANKDGLTFNGAAAAEAA